MIFNLQDMGELTMTNPIRYPHVSVRLVGEDGNAFAIMGRVTLAPRWSRSC